MSNFHGNLVELVIILFSPIFVNKKFTYYISLGLILKYSLVGIYIQAPLVLFPIGIMIVLSIISFIILQCFLNYIKALKYSYDMKTKEELNTMKEEVETLNKKFEEPT